MKTPTLDERNEALSFLLDKYGKIKKRRLFYFKTFS